MQFHVVASLKSVRHEDYCMRSCATVANPLGCLMQAYGCSLTHTVQPCFLPVSALRPTDLTLPGCFFTRVVPSPPSAPVYPPIDVICFVWHHRLLSSINQQLVIKRLLMCHNRPTQCSCSWCPLCPFLAGISVPEISRLLSSCT